jgi:hypothetical protein
LGLPVRRCRIVEHVMVLSVVVMPVGGAGPVALLPLPEQAEARLGHCVQPVCALAHSVVSFCCQPVRLLSLCHVVTFWACDTWVSEVRASRQNMAADRLRRGAYIEDLQRGGFANRARTARANFINGLGACQGAKWGQNGAFPYTHDSRPEDHQRDECRVPGHLRSSLSEAIPVLNDRHRSWRGCCRVPRSWCELKNDDCRLRFR